MYQLGEHDSEQPACKRMLCLQSRVKDFAPFSVQASKIVSWFSQDFTRVPVGNTCILWYLQIITDFGSEEASKTRQ